MGDLFPKPPFNGRRRTAARRLSVPLSFGGAGGGREGALEGLAGRVAGGGRGGGAVSGASLKGYRGDDGFEVGGGRSRRWKERLRDRKG